MGISGKQNKEDIFAVQDVKGILEVIMSRNNKLSQKGRTHAKSLITISFLVIAFMIIPMVSAFEFDNIKSYNSDLKVATFTNAYGMGEVLGQARLITPHNVKVGLGYQKVAEFDLSSYSDYDNILKGFTFKDLKTGKAINRDIDIKFKTYEDYVVNDYKKVCVKNLLLKEGGKGNLTSCSMVLVGNHTNTREIWTDKPTVNLKRGELLHIGLWTNVQEGDYIDWIPTLYGKKVNEWASWTANLNTDLRLYYKMESTDVLDSTDNHYNGANSGTATTTGKIDNALYFTESEHDSIEVVNSTTSLSDILPDSSEGTINMWININSNPSIEHFIYELSIGSNQRLYMTTYSGYGIRVSYMNKYTDYPVSTGSWHMITTTWDSSGNLHLWVDGVDESSTTGATDIGWDGATSRGLGKAFSSNNRHFDGAIDEFSIWNRKLTDTEIGTTLWNGGDGITIETESSIAPSVILSSPSNNSNLTSANVDMIATITDDQYVQNVTLYLDGVANETNNSGINGSYTFSKTVSEGYHNWSILAYDNQSLSNQSDTWYFNYTQSPIYIDLLSPTDSSTSQISLVNVSCRAYENEGIEALNLIINGIVNYTVTNSTPAENLTLERVMNFSEGNYTWSCTAVNPSTSAQSSNRTFEVLYSSPIVYQDMPIAYANLTTNNINFTSNVTDANGISSVELKIDGIIQETNNSGVNGSYNFNREVTDGNHNWSIVANSIWGKSTTSAVRQFEIDSTSPVINITAPLATFDYLTDGEILNLNWTVNDSNLDKCWDAYTNKNLTDINEDYWHNGNLYGWIYVSNYSNQNITLSGVNWAGTNPYVKIYKNSLTTIGDYQQAYISHSSNSTEIVTDTFNLNLNENGWHYFNLFASDIGAFESNRMDVFKLTNPISYAQNIIIVNCSENTTTFEYIQGKNEITLFANDTFGNIGYKTKNWTSLIGTFNINYDTPVYEGYQNTITATVEDLSTGSSLTSALLYYNGTNYTTSINYSAGDYIISSTLSAPAVTVDTNYTFGFYLTIDGTIYNPQSNNQTVLNANFGKCGNVSNDTILTLNLVDEDLQLPLLGDIEVGGEIKSVSSGETIGTIYSNYSNSSNASLCFSPPSAYDLYYMNAEIRYTSSGYSSELYYIQNADITDDLGNLTLYDINSSKATSFKVIYQDSNYNFVDGAIIQLQRKYISEGTYKTVEAPLTSSEGVAILHINSDAIGYRATVVKNGVVLDEFNNIVFKCQSELTGECNYNLLGDINSDNEENLDNTRDFYYSNPTIINNTVEVSFSIPSGSPSSVNVVLEQKDQFGNKSLCNKTIVSSAGSVSCDFSESLGRSYIDFWIYKDGESIARKSYSTDFSNDLDWLGNNYIFMFILLLSLVGMALTSPEWIIVNGIVTMVISGTLYLANDLDFVIGLGSIVWLVIAGIILISKMAKQEDR